MVIGGRSAPNLENMPAKTGITQIFKATTAKPTAIKTNEEWAFSDPNYPTMAGVADAAIQHDLKNTNSLLSRSINNGIKQAINKSDDVNENDWYEILAKGY